MEIGRLTGGCCCLALTLKKLFQCKSVVSIQSLSCISPQGIPDGTITVSCLLEACSLGLGFGGGLTDQWPSQCSGMLGTK